MTSTNEVVFTATPWLDSPFALHGDGDRSAVEIRGDGIYRPIIVNVIRREVTSRGRFSRSATKLSRFLAA